MKVVKCRHEGEVMRVKLFEGMRMMKMMKISVSVQVVSAAFEVSVQTVSRCSLTKNTSSFFFFFFKQEHHFLQRGPTGCMYFFSEES